MTIHFALLLSFEGIELLHRAKRGWKQVGTVSVEDDNLDEALAGLRAKALKIAPDGLATKLIIPMDQIKYLAIDSTQTNLDDIHAALDGATPYDLNELVIDYERSGGRTHIAAVARETLQEAQAFASAHKFNPVAFVAVPEPFTFQKEVFFGPTSEAVQILGAGVAVERDHLPVMKVGTRVKSRVLIMDPLPDAIAQTEADTALALPPQPVADLAPVADIPVPRVDPPLEQRAIDRIIPEFAATHVALAAIVPETPAPVAAAPAARVIWVDRTVPEHWPAPVEITPPAAAARPVLAQDPAFADISRMDPIIAEFRPDMPAAPKPVLTAIAPDIPAAATGAVLTATKPQFAVQPRKKAPVVALGLAASVAAAAAVFAWSQWGALGPQETAGATSVTVTTQAAPAPDAPTVTAEAAPHVPALDIFPMAPPAMRPALVVMPAPLSAPSSRVEPQRVVAAQIETPPQFSTQDSQTPTERGADQPAGQVLSPAEAQAAYEATGVWQRAPRLFDTPRIASQAAVTLPDIGATPQRAAQPAPLSHDAMAPDLSFLAPVNPPAPDVVFEVDENGHIVPTADGALTPEGAVVYAGLPDLPMRVRPALTDEQLATMAALADVPDGVVVILGSPDIVPPTRPDDLVPQAAQDETAADGTPTAGAVGLDGLEDDAAQLAGLAPPEGIARPRPRPDDLVPPAATEDPATPDITAVLESIIAEDGSQPFIDTTEQAVATSLRPTARPRNFATVVAAARERLAAQPAAAPTPAPAAAAPVAPQNYAPVPGGVAVAATQEGVIRLREINLIGIYGRPNAPRALVRLANGRYAHVEVGSSLDGGQVTAIGNGVLNYVKRGRTIVLEVPGD
ncbi:hypothetical protein SAMN04488005_0842 [Yoonia tamlensis]|uniref:Type IV pilus biogenesis protein PilP n=1 Tax=Yoonia tamlensis TaxID=390270 RepID=A0A1I6G0E2_9RHOB|nr:hypothetical protein [Yoonia tamlensis]SFR35610.1 hypothetical protein SAMN04488005_0842 [Yoonia tamlensis]